MQNSSAFVSTGVSEMAREKLREAVIAFGRHAFSDPRRCEAILRDLCPAAPREIFLLVSALRENVASELLGSGAVPEEAITAKLTRRLSESLGLAEGAAQWAVESWQFALDNNPGLEGLGEGLRPRSVRQDVPPRESPAVGAAEAPLLDWPWLAMCLVAAAAAALALVGGAWIAFFHYWRTWPGALAECATLAAALAASGFAQVIAARSFEQMAAPDHRALDPRKVPYALLPEVVVILLMPLAAAGLPFLWIAEWWGELHAAGAPHTGLFHAVRGFESLLLAAFLYFWIPAMVLIQGKLAASLVRRR